MTETLQEKRRHVRKRLTVTANVFKTQDQQSIGRVFDISQEGFMLLTPSRVQPSDVLDLTIEIPELDSTRNIAMSAECIWCQPSSFSKEFGAGFLIRNISDQDQVALNYFIRDF